MIVAAILAALQVASPLAAQDADCGVAPIEQRFQWTREFQGLAEPLQWTVTHALNFSAADDAGVHTIDEVLAVELPEFRWRFQQYLGSADIDSCSTRFYLLARTPSARPRHLDVPVVVDYQRARCAVAQPDCQESANLIGECRRQARDILVEELAEIDVDFSIDLGGSGLASAVSFTRQPLYGELNDPQAIDLLDRTLSVAATALNGIVDSAAQVSLARLAPDLAPLAVEGGYLDEGGDRFELRLQYRVSPRQVCRARLRVEDYGARHRPAP